MLDLTLNIAGPIGLNVTAQCQSTVTAILGESASGKTTLLRTIAGLNNPFTGSLYWRGQDITTRPPHHRPFAMVQQEPALFPHWSLQQHITEIRRNALGSRLDPAQLLNKLALQDLLHKRPQQLSGGQQQRVALLLALLREPQLLLLDEPFSALDHSTKQRIFPVLLATLNQLGAQALLVSHQLRDCAALANKALILENQSINGEEAIGSAMRRYQGNKHVHSLLDAVFVTHHDDSRLAQFNMGDQRVFAFKNNDQELSKGEKVRLAIYADDIGICLSKPEDSSFVNILDARITGLERSEHGYWVQCETGQQDIVIEVSKKSQEKLFLQPEKNVYLLAKAGAIDVLGPINP